MFFVLLFCFVDDFFELDELALCFGFAQLRTLYKVLPLLFCRFFSGFFWPSGVSSFFFLLLLLPPLGGWAPLAAFSLRFPLGSRAGGGCVLCFCFALLHLASSL